MASVADLEQQAADTRAAGGDGALLSGILCDLADLKMGKGEVEAAQELLQEAYQLRKDAIEGAAAAPP
ncbi:hypothetical protein MNEG_8455, partial [Monoraphidium neglectum]